MDKANPVQICFLCDIQMFVFFCMWIVLVKWRKIYILCLFVFFSHWDSIWFWFVYKIWTKQIRHRVTIWCSQADDAKNKRSKKKKESYWHNMKWFETKKILSVIRNRFIRISFFFLSLLNLIFTFVYYFNIIIAIPEIIPGNKWGI